VRTLVDRFRWPVIDGIVWANAFLRYRNAVCDGGFRASTFSEDARDQDASLGSDVSRAWRSYGDVVNTYSEHHHTARRETETGDALCTTTAPAPPLPTVADCGLPPTQLTRQCAVLPCHHAPWSTVVCCTLLRKAQVVLVASWLLASNAHHTALHSSLFTVHSHVHHSSQLALRTQLGKQLGQ
jgi:hypothetical protein